MNGTVTVLGSFVVDLMGRCGRIPAPGETVKGSFFRMGAGGKGSNQAVAAYRSGCQLHLITKLGNDLFSSVALDFYKKEGIDTSSVIVDTVPGSQTGTALITVEDGTSQNSIVVVPGACGTISMDELKARAAVLRQSPFLLCQLETNTDILPYAAETVRAGGGYTILNPAPAPSAALPPAFYRLWDMVTPNETEASTITGIRVTGYRSAAEAAAVFAGWGVKDVVITLGKQGALLLPHGLPPQVYPAIPVGVVDTTGAGDAFNGGLAAAMARGLSLEKSMLWAMAVSALAVTKIGTADSMPLKAEVEEFLSHMDTDDYFRRVRAGIDHAV
jgi:ribokinase